MSQLILVKAFPESAKDLVIEKNGKYHVYVKAPAVNGLANLEIRRVLADFLRMSKKDLRLIRGHKQSAKVFEVLNHI